MVSDGFAIAIGITTALVGGGLVVAAPTYAREMERYALGLGPLRAVLVPPFIPKTRARLYLRWLARIVGSIIAIVGVLFAASGLRGGNP